MAQTEPRTDRPSAGTPASHPVDAYALSVVSGLVPAGKYHRLSCERHLRDRAREGTPGFPYRFEAQQADRFLRFARQMKHYKGRQFAGKHFDPTPCQVFRLGCVFGWRHVETGFRRFTTAYNELTRKSGKSFEAAIVAIYVTFFENEPGAEGYCIATKEKQSRIVFDVIKRLVRSSGLADRIKVNAANLYRASTEQKLEPLGSDSDTTDGLNPHCIVTDELHAFKVRGLLDVVESATGARLNPLHYQITTAGNDPVSPGGDQHDYACKILDGVFEEDASTVSFFAFIAHADPEDDWLSEETWKKANPHWGISVDPEDMRKLAAKAKHMPSAAAEFKQKRLNLWVNAHQPWLSMDGWRAGQSDWSPDDLVGQSCYVGIDLASKLDLLSLSFLFPPVGTRVAWRLLNYIWTPEATMVERSHRDRAPYPVWAKSAQQWLRTMPGTEMDYERVREVLKLQRSRFQIEFVGLDPWHADKMGRELVTHDGFPEGKIVHVSQTYAGMSSAAQHFEAAVLAGKMDARRCPVTQWSASNAVVQKDGKDNIYPVKNKSRGRIDPIMSAVIAMSLAIRAMGKPQPQYQMIVVGATR